MRWALFRRLILGATVQERREEYVKTLDGQLPTSEQLRRLGQLTADAFLAIRNTEDLDCAFALADAFHNLPMAMFWPGFRWSFFLMELNILVSKYPEIGSRFLDAFDDVVGFKAQPSE